MFLLLLLLVSLVSAQMNLHLSPELIALAAEEVRIHAALRFTPITPLAIASASGITSDYFNNTTCDAPRFAQLSVPYGTCFKNYIGPQPNCTVVTDCLTRASNFEEYNACLVPTVFLYTNVGAYNTSGYLVRLFVDDTCTTPFTEFESLVILFGCQPAQIYDEYGNFCDIYQNLVPYITTASKLQWLAPIIAIWVVGAAIVVFIVAFLLYFQHGLPAKKARNK